MLAKKPAKNQVTRPKEIADRFPDTVYFDVRVEGRTITLRPARIETEGEGQGCARLREEVGPLGAYPKFRLTRGEIPALLERELLPYAEVVDVPEDARTWCRDPADDKFIRCALAARCRYLVSGDEDLVALREVDRVRIVTPDRFLRTR